MSRLKSVWKHSKPFLVIHVTTSGAALLPLQSINWCLLNTHVQLFVSVPLVVLGIQVGGGAGVGGADVVVVVAVAVVGGGGGSSGGRGQRGIGQARIRKPER